MNRGLPGLFLSIWIAWMPQNAWAVILSCTVSATGVSFGTYTPFSPPPVDSSGTVTVNCLGVLGGIFTVKLNTGGSGTFSPRKMYKGTDTLNYNLYTDSGRTTIWGDGTGGTSFQTVDCGLACLGADNNFTTYGRIPGSQTAAVPGSYSDTITVTVEW